MKDRLIFFDFDGVLFDTVREAYASAVIAGGRSDTLDDVDYNSSHYETFRKLRYLISPAWNYKYLLEVLESGREAVQIKKLT
jgi:FMN phosphatase YigB (HAD superfamily)